MLPTKEVTDRVKQSAKYQSIAASINEVGLVEPIVVYRKPDRRNQYLLLDGHLKRMILMERGDTEVECILADDDEAFTYNKRINRIGTVQEHFLILRAIERGISEEKLARALGIKIEAVKHRQSLLRGISDEVANLLMDKPANPVVFDLLRKMKPMRQAEAARLMVSTATYSSAYARALLIATSETDLVRPRRRLPPPIVTSADLALMERELKKAQQDFKTVELAYGADMVNLVIATRYVSTLLGRSRIVDYLDANHPEILREFRSIVAAISTHGQQVQQANAVDKDARHGATGQPLARKFFPSRGRKWQRPEGPPKRSANRRK
ncbi:plasmid partitioning protein RepB C-terminal domain-containing protein [Bradyrhizobium acaciae]|uniref:plasmid partitioning protein RepB C-terminal domain-containing protein n=1 Tax=Bradyrhizobium acaciae TaxID=2683706 RepID=UPI001E4FA29E|nr:plasmid partitioning protein RepB C-terminal domain-containing protein [Bradyrhizobium acaciae]MCC8977298.1 ParB N-terminal domain-containing protein [Bradyrhizobium acaciae]